MRREKHLRWKEVNSSKALKSNINFKSELSQSAVLLLLTIVTIQKYLAKTLGKTHMGLEKSGVH